MYYPFSVSLLISLYFYSGFMYGIVQIIVFKLNTVKGSINLSVNPWLTAVSALASVSFTTPQSAFADMSRLSPRSALQPLSRHSPTAPLTQGSLFPASSALTQGSLFPASSALTQGRHFLPVIMTGNIVEKIVFSLFYHFLFNISSPNRFAIIYL